ncbi:MAG: hypothetical protein AAGF36_07690 [Pseudomonadota bacterium]
MKPGQSTFDERLLRINKGRTLTATDVQPASHRLRAAIATTPNARKLYLNFMVTGAIVGGLAGMFFAQAYGLPALLAMNGETLYALAEDQVMTLVYIFAAVLGPVAWVLSQIIARGAPKARRFWFGYMCGVLAANGKDIEPHVQWVRAEYGPIIAPYTDPVLEALVPHFETARAAIAPHVQTVMSMLG